jgi:uncharacterized coiled-coil DUF342 family protein
MDRKEEIKMTIERNSKKINEYTQIIQQLKDELRDIDSKIKWTPSSELDEKDSRKAYGLSVSGIALSPSHGKHMVQMKNVSNLKKRRVEAEKELEDYMKKKEELRNESLQLREELMNLK